MINYNKPATQLVWDQINRDNPQLKKPLNATNVALLQGPLTTNLQGGRNTRVVVSGIQGGGYNGKMDIYYDRLILGYYFVGTRLPVRVPYSATLYRDIVQQISEASGLQITVEDLQFPDSQFAAQTVVTGDRQLTLKTTNLAFSGGIPFTFTREEPSFADLYPITQTGAWELPDVYSTVYRLDWSNYAQQIFNIPMRSALKAGANSYVSAFISALSAWSGYPFTIGGAPNDNPYDLYRYVATRDNNPGVNPEMRGEFNICVKLTPPEDMGNLRRPIYLHMSPKNNVKYMSQVEDLQRYMKYMGIPLTTDMTARLDSPGAYSAMVPVEGISSMYGTPYANRFGDTSHRSRVIQHAFPNATLWRAAIADKTPIMMYTARASYSSVQYLPAVDRNGYLSVSLSNWSSVGCNNFIYYDATQGGYMSWNPGANSTPVAWYPPYV